MLLNTIVDIVYLAFMKSVTDESAAINSDSSDFATYLMKNVVVHGNTCQ